MTSPATELLWATPSVLELYEESDLARRWDCDGWHRTLAAFAERTTLCEILRPLLDDEHLARKVAAQSYRHITGFEKLVLLRDSTGALIKLDIWWPGHEAWAVLDNIHSHAWNFSSVVLSGGLEMRHFVPSTHGMPARLYRLSYPPGTFTREPQVRHLLPVWTAKLGRMSSYDIDFRVLHSTSSAPDALTVTLVVQSRALRDYSETALYRDIPDDGAGEAAWRAAEENERLGEQMLAFEFERFMERVGQLAALGI